MPTTTLTTAPAATATSVEQAAAPANYAVLFSSKTDDWPTPQDFYDFAFALDVCSSTANHKAEKFYALDHADPTHRDGLGRDWAADVVGADGTPTGAIWMNPPYGKGIDQWMAKAHEAALNGATVVCLVPVRTSAHWWHDTVLATGCEVRWVRGRLTFGNAKTTAAFSSAVVIYRPTDIAGAPGPSTVMTAKVKPSKTAQASKAAA